MSGVSTRSSNAVIDGLLIMDALANSKSGMTVGEIMKLFPNLTRRVVQKLLDNHEEAGLAYHELVEYGRTGKKIYRVTEFFAMVCASIARGYTK